MRLLLDLQCVQSTSALRGIGRYAVCLAHALVEGAEEHQVEVLLNGGDDPVRLVRAREALESFVPPRAVHVFDADWPWEHAGSEERRCVAELARAAAVESLRPDVLLIASVFEGDGETVLSVDSDPGAPPTAAVLHDLFPAMDPGTYLLGPGAASYWRRYEDLRRTDLLLSNSVYSAEQAHALLGEACPPVVPVFGGPYPSGRFPAFEHRNGTRTDLDLPSRFLLTVGGDHTRKNLDRLVLAWAQVPVQARAGVPLVLACRLNPGTVRRLRRTARRAGLQPRDLLVLGEVSESTLAELYRAALAFVFPSTQEGLGLPALEAMNHGCAVLLARGSSLSELAEDEEVFFDPLDVEDIARAMTRVLTEVDLVSRLRAAAETSAARFTWRNSAERAWAALLRLPRRPAEPNAPAPSPMRAAPAAGGELDVVAASPCSPQPTVVHGSDLACWEGSHGQDPAEFRTDLRAARAALAPAAALLTDSAATTNRLIAAGLLDLPVLEAAAPATIAAATERASEHDFYAAYGRRLSRVDQDPERARGTVDAVLRTPRWMLERPRPVWLLLAGDEVDGEAAAGLRALASDLGGDLAVAGPSAALLAGSADAVLVEGRLLSAILPQLLHARGRGAVVLVSETSTGAVPEWCRRVTLTGPSRRALSWRGALTAAAEVGRQTGWPWRVDG